MIAPPSHPSPAPLLLIFRHADRPRGGAIAAWATLQSKIPFLDCQNTLPCDSSCHMNASAIVISCHLAIYDFLFNKINDEFPEGNTGLKVHTGIEIARLVALLAVVSLHANAYGIFGEDRLTGFVVDELSRFAVPLFFLISGYLWKDSYLASPAQPLAKLFRRLVLPFVVWVIFYLFCEISELFYPGTFPNPASIRSYIFIPLSGGPGFHLWFLPALFIGTAIGWLAVRHLGLSRALVLAAALYLVGTALALYARSKNFDAILWIYRNGFFFAPIFLLVGHAMRNGRLPGVPLLILVALAGATLHLAEGLYLFDRFPKGHDMSLGTVPLAVGLFGLFLHVRIQSAAVVSWGRDVFGAYLVHLFFLRIFAAHVEQRGTAIALACIAATLVASLVISRLMKMSAITRPVVS